MEPQFGLPRSSHKYRFGLLANNIYLRRSKIMRKNILKCIALVLTAGILCFTGCGGDESVDPIETDEPTIVDPTEPDEPTVDGTYSISIDSCTGGSVKASATKAAAGDTITLTATPDDSYVFGDWYVFNTTNGTNISVKNNTFTMPAGDVQVSATFDEIDPNAKYWITLADIQNGIVDLSISTPYHVTAGTEITLTASPHYGYYFDSFSVTRDDTGNNVTVTDGKFTMPAGDVTVNATFVELPDNTYSITVSSTANGSLETMKSAAEKGETVNLYATPSEGYELESISVKDADQNDVEVEISGRSGYFTMPESNVTVSATFKKIINNLPVPTADDYSLETLGAYTVLNSISYTSPYSQNATYDVSTGGGYGTYYISFGTFPQTIKAESVTVDETKTTTQGGNTYYLGSDYYWYAKVTENGFVDTNGLQLTTSYSDGTSISVASANSTKYFKVEPIIWRKLGTSDILLAESVLTAGIPYYGKSEKRREEVVNGNYDSVFSNHYKYSNIRAYLNGIKNAYAEEYADKVSNISEEYDIDWTGKGFLQIAFTENQQAKIATTTVTNTGVLNNYVATTLSLASTDDKIFLLTRNDFINSDLGFNLNDSIYDSSKTGLLQRQRTDTDYALANFAYGFACTPKGESKNYYCGNFWSRTPATTSNVELQNRVWGVNYVGDYTSSNSIFESDLNSVGICPALTIVSE